MNNPSQSKNISTSTENTKNTLERQKIRLHIEDEMSKYIKNEAEKQFLRPPILNAIIKIFRYLSRLFIADTVQKSMSEFILNSNEFSQLNTKKNLHYVSKKPKNW